MSEAVSIKWRGGRVRKRVKEILNYNGTARTSFAWLRGDGKNWRWKMWEPDGWQHRRHFRIKKKIVVVENKRNDAAEKHIREVWSKLKKKQIQKIKYNQTSILKKWHAIGRKKAPRKEVPALPYPLWWAAAAAALATWGEWGEGEVGRAIKDPRSQTLGVTSATETELSASLLPATLNKEDITFRDS